LPPAAGACAGLPQAGALGASALVAVGEAAVTVPAAAAAEEAAALGGAAAEPLA